MEFGIVDIERETLLSTTTDEDYAKVMLYRWGAHFPDRKLAIRPVTRWGGSWRFAR